MRISCSCTYFSHHLTFSRCHFLPGAVIGQHFHNKCEEMFKVYDAFNLGDPLVGVPVDPIPQFITLRLDRSLLKQVNNMNHGSGSVQYRRALQPAVFSTEWAYVDHLLIPPGSVVGPDAKADIAEVYYVLAGDGTVKVNSGSAQIHNGDAIPIRLGESKSFTNTGSGPLELMIIGVAKDMATKDMLWATPPLH